MTHSFEKFIRLTGVETHNLQGLDVAIPLGEITVVTGVSGSGKSSLVFDSLYAESYRRYVESLSSFARQYMQALPRPDLAEVSNLPPAVAVKQARGGGNARSTVGTATELYDLVRVLYTHLSTIYCYECGKPVQKDNPERVLRKVLEERPGDRVHILAPLTRFEAMKADDLLFHLESQGFGRVWHEGGVKKLEEVRAKDLLSCKIVVDRAKLDATQLSRLTQSLILASQIGGGDFALLVGDDEVFSYSLRLTCCGVQYRRPTLSLFSFNHPRGACEHCQGFGYEAAIDWEKVLPDLAQSLGSRGVVPWNFGSHDDMYEWARGSARRHKIGWTKKFSDYSTEEMQWLKDGGDRDDFPGVVGYFSWLNSKRHKAHYRIHAARFRKYKLCTECGGDRLNRFGRACRLHGKTIAALSQLSLDQLEEWLIDLTENSQEYRSNEAAGVAEAMAEMRARLSYLLRVGLGYLTINRQTKTLSGGEMQRINMARCLGSALTDTLYCLDEPTAGLHPRDSKSLLSVIEDLKSQGNTVVVVEHERTIIEGADHLIEVGPSAGSAGGQIVYAGQAESVPLRQVDWRVNSAASNLPISKLRAATMHNLKGDEFQLPSGANFVVVCGVSGSGKTTLIQHCLHAHLVRVLTAPESLNRLEDEYGAFFPDNALRKFTEVMLVGQEGIGRSSRSNIITYLGIYDSIRKLLARDPVAAAAGLTPSSFSFNSSGGRCEQCRGLGVVREDLSFLGEMDTICSECNGRRFNDEVLSVAYREHSLDQILKLTVDEARALFCDQRDIVRGLEAAIKLGLGYLTLGQSTSSFSGGEAQRLKLVKLLNSVAPDDHRILIFDEPTTGLSDVDVVQLIAQLRYLVERGHLVIAVEHHLGMIASADWVCELGPGAADAGGRVVFQGPPAGLAAVRESETGKFIKLLQG